MTQVSGDIAAIAAGLSVAQRGFVLRLADYWTSPFGMSPAVTSYRDPTLIERRSEAAGSPYRLTPLGLAVRAYLEGKSHD